MTLFLGFDPGGLRSFGCAAFHVDEGILTCATVSSVDEAMAFALRFGAPLGCGIDTLLYWQSTPSGWRGADRYLRQRYPHCAKSVVSSNGLYGSMSVQGAILAARLRQLWQSMLLTETHPKVLWRGALGHQEYPRDSAGFRSALSGLLGAHIRQDVQDEHQFDAALSAWSALKVSNGDWTLDLSTIAEPRQITANIGLVLPVVYGWPA